MTVEILRRVIKVTWSHRLGPNERGPYRKRASEHRHARWDDHVKTQREHGRLHGQERPREELTLPTP